jgi:hypothetical protein
VSYQRNPMHQHLADCQVLESHGVSLPAQWIDTRARWAEYIETVDTCGTG